MPPGSGATGAPPVGFTTAPPFAAPDEPPDEAPEAGASAGAGFPAGGVLAAPLPACVPPPPLGAAAFPPAAGVFGFAGESTCFGAALPVGWCGFVPASSAEPDAAATAELFPGALADCDVARPGWGDSPCFVRPGLDAGFPCRFASIFAFFTSAACADRGGTAAFGALVLRVVFLTSAGGVLAGA